MLNLHFRTLRSTLGQLKRDQRGASAIEYIIVVGLIAIMAIAGFKKFGDTADRKIEAERSALENLKVP